MTLMSALTDMRTPKIFDVVLERVYASGDAPKLDEYYTNYISRRIDTRAMWNALMIHLSEHQILCFYVEAVVTPDGKETVG